ncbi:protein FAR1-RELATED SEQUENCE 5-like [Arachis stenosperma]|uniref:protein FAR1-RELATED SEQUENCE 5-like n=1 Tax=Arachis stenosperma TaxID=217475 RepID=UPI0025ACA62F|nr:protein FAR1-RELATED SEQUENCE 5-like [Arachis stenosperma]
MSIYLDKSEQTWKVKKVILELNHELTHVGMVHMIADHCSMANVAKSQIDRVNVHGISTSKIVGYMTGMAGRYSLVSFLKNDAYNYADKSRRKKIVDDDANATIGYLEGKAIANHMSIMRYNLINDRRLGNLIWADGGSGVNYQYFGDVLAFDSTYKKNKYRRPVLIFFLFKQPQANNYLWVWDFHG